MTIKTQLPTVDSAPPGCDDSIVLPAMHHVNGNRMDAPWPQGHEMACFALGCFWGAERLFWVLDGVYSTQVGYAGGMTKNPTYEQVCGGRTGHTEVVRVIFDPDRISYLQLLATFWENHDPTQGMRQGNDIGSQYRSAIFSTTSIQLAAALASGERYQLALGSQHQRITTQIESLDTFYPAEAYHQQYLSKNPNGYCGIGGLGICLPPAESSS